MNNVFLQKLLLVYLVLPEKLSINASTDGWFPMRKDELAYYRRMFELCREIQETENVISIRTLAENKRKREANVLIEEKTK